MLSLARTNSLEVAIIGLAIALLLSGFVAIGLDSTHYPAGRPPPRARDPVLDLSGSFPTSEGSYSSCAPPCVVATISVGTEPGGATYDRATGEVFVTNHGSSSVSVIQASNNTVVGTVTVAPGPYGITYDSGRGEIYVASSSGSTGNVSVISDSNESVVSSIGVGPGPYAAAYDSAKGEVFLTMSGLHEVLVISDSNDSVLATVPAGGGPYGPDGVAYDAARGEVFVADESAGTVTVINDTTDTVVATISVGYGPDGIAYDSARGEIFVANRDSNNVSVISDSADKVVATVNVGHIPIGVAYDPGSGQVFVSNNNCASSPCGPGSVSVISDAADQVVATLGVGGAPSFGVAYDSALGEIFVTNQYTNNVSVIRGGSSSAPPSSSSGSGILGLPSILGLPGLDGYALLTALIVIIGTAGAFASRRHHRPTSTRGAPSASSDHGQTSKLVVSAASTADQEPAPVSSPAWRGPTTADATEVELTGALAWSSARVVAPIVVGFTVLFIGILLVTLTTNPCHVVNGPNGQPTEGPGCANFNSYYDYVLPIELGYAFISIGIIAVIGGFAAGAYLSSKKSVK